MKIPGTHSKHCEKPTNLVLKRASMRGFLFSDHTHLTSEAISCLGQWLTQGKLAYEVDVKEGFSEIPKTLQRLFAGNNLGKQLLKL